MPRDLADRSRVTLPYLPGIDGLRAISVLAVLLYHAQVSWMPGGFLGVEVFFVISGYLITALLLAERRGTGGVALGRFWLRRARRLLPALFVMLGVTLLVATVFLRDELAGLRGDAAASLGYVTNWYLIFSDQSYFEAFGRPSLFQHLWSLAVEEQFYLLWPLAFAGGMKLLGRRHLMWGVAAGVVASTALMWALFEPGADPSRIYYGTDTRAAGLLIGVFLAFVWHPARLRPRTGPGAPVLLDVVGCVALVALLHQLVTTTEFDAALYQGGFARVSLLTAAVIAVAAHPAAHLGRVLGVRPLVWIGLRSYSIYLWHWPVYMLTRPGQDVPLDGFWLLATRLALAVGLGALSYRWIELPVRRGALGRRWGELREAARDGYRPVMRRWALAGGTTTLAVLLVAGAVLAADAPDEPDLVIGDGTGAGEVVAPTAAQMPAPPTSATTTTTSRAAPVATTPTTAVPATTSTTAEPPRRRTFLALGDSVMLGAAQALTGRFGDDVIVDAVVARTFEEGIWSAHYHDQIGTLPDTVVVHLGNNDPYFTDEQFDRMMEALGPDRRAVFLTVKVNQRYESAVNARLAAGAERWSNATLADWKGISESQPGVFAPDDTHLDPPGARLYADFVAAQVGP